MLLLARGHQTRIPPRAHVAYVSGQVRAADYTVWVGERSNAEWVERAARSCAASASALHNAGVQPEALAEFVPEGRRLRVLRRPATMRPLGRVWRLGALLLGTYETNAHETSAHEIDAEEINAASAHPMLFAAGRATRAAERGRPNFQDVSREGRRELAAAALRGGYPVGTPVNFDATPLPLEAEALLALGSDSPIGVHGDETSVHDTEIRVRWRPGSSWDDAPTLERYLEERVGLLVDPPFTST